MWPQARISSFEMLASNNDVPVCDAFYAAGNMIVDAIIPPADTRSVI